MPSRLALVAFLTDDYDKAIAWFQTTLGFVLLEDSDHGGGKRWVRMGAHPHAETQFLIARAATPDQAKGIGRHAGGRVGYFLTVDDFAQTHAQMTKVGVHFEEAARHEPYGTVAVFQDLHGNRWDLIQPV